VGYGQDMNSRLVSLKGEGMEDRYSDVIIAQNSLMKFLNRINVQLRGANRKYKVYKDLL